MKSSIFTRSGAPAMRRRLFVKGNWVYSLIHHNRVVTYRHLDLNASLMKITDNGTCR
jgi:hypothetical protein